MTVVDLEQEQKNRKRSANKAAVEAEVTEDAVAIGFRDRLSGRFFFDHERQRWLRWDGQRWRVDKTSYVMECVREIIREKAGDQTPGSRVRLGRYSFACGVEKFARSDRTFAVDGTAWDSDPLLLGTPNGTVDLRTGELRPATPEDQITKTSAIVPAQHGECPMWLKFLAEAAGDDADLIRFIQQFCGYSLTGSTKEHVLIFVYGPGGNGKSVFVNTLTGIFGEYCTTAPMDTLISSRSDRHPTEVARLMGARLVTASETEKNHVFAEAKLKALTGGDRVAARFMRQDFFEFIPTCKWIVVGNHKPSLTCVDDAIKRRLFIVPFIRQPAHPDCDLEEKLKAEWPAILRWMIEGCLDYLTNGLVRPATVVAATDEYFENQDLFGQWLDEKCDIDAGNRHVWDPVADLYVSWSAFTNANGEQPGSKKHFSETMQSRGFRSEKGAKGTRIIRGIRLTLAGECHAD
jgi:putative DNA primase/helicase